MNIVASAPGKVVLLGEYAVLEGAPALSMAVNRLAVVTMRARPGQQSEVHAPDILDEPVSLTLSAAGTPQWADDAVAKSLALVDQVFRGLAQQAAPAESRAGAFTLQLDTSAFFDQSEGELHKLGLGSSAALTVALASALAEYQGDAECAANRGRWLERLLQLHREFQHGQGSGVDVATSLFGGLIEYRASCAGKSAQVRAVRWPQTLHYHFVWSGRSASTPKLLERLQDWRRAHTAAYASRMSDLSSLAEAGAMAVGKGDAAALLQAIAHFATALRQLGEASGIGIFSAEHLRLAELARRSAVVYKSCGAGGGDVGVAFALDPERLQHYADAIARERFRSVQMDIDEDGLKVVNTEMEEA